MQLALIPGFALMVASLGAVAEDVTPTFDITGVWNSAGGGTFQVFQEGAKATVVFVTPDFAHLSEMKYKKPATLTGRQTRVTRAGGCTTDAWVTYTVLSSDVISVSAVALDSNCDLVKGQVFTDAGTRVL